MTPPTPRKDGASLQALSTRSLQPRSARLSLRARASSTDRSASLRALLTRPGLDFLMEAHSGLSARIAEEAGFPALWASGLSISAALGLRDSNEASWTQVLDVLEYMADATHLPILVDGDTGYGNFNNVRRLVQKLEQRRLAGVCIEDKLFPKTNSFLNGHRQPLAEVDEFCGRIQAAKDAQRSDDFVLVARTEAFIAGWGLKEALRRAEAYHQAGADAILIHSAKRTADEVLAFRAEWGERTPVVIVPTKYYTTPTQIFEEAGFSAAIWANQLMRASLAAMQTTARQLAESRSAVAVEERVAPLQEVFRLQETDELEEAEQRYLPKRVASVQVVVLGHTRGADMPDLTESRPKCMVEVGGVPILSRIVEAYRSAGFDEIAVVRGYKKESVRAPGVRFFDLEDAEAKHEAGALHAALPALEGDCIVCYGDVLFRKFIPRELAEVEADFAVFVDTNWQESRNRTRYADYVSCSQPFSRRALCSAVQLRTIAPDLDPARIHGEWMGFLKVARRAVPLLRQILSEIAADPAAVRTEDMGALMRRLIEKGQEIRVLYTSGHWLDIDTVEDALEGGSFC